MALTHGTRKPSDNPFVDAGLGRLYLPTLRMLNASITLTGLDFTVDVWRIRKEGNVALGTADSGLKSQANNPGLVVREPWSNQGSAEVRGIDLSGSYRKNMGDWGGFGLNADLIYLSDYLIATQPGDKENHVVGSAAGQAPST